MSRTRDLTTVLGGGNASYLRQLYATYLEDPASITPEWREYFAGLPQKKRLQTQKHTLQEISPIEDDKLFEFAPRSYQALRKGKYELPLASPREALDAIQGALLAEAYRSHGHLAALLDPLVAPFQPPSFEEFLENLPHPFLEPQTYGFQDLDLPFYGGGGYRKITIRAFLEELRAVYCGPVGCEFMHLLDPQQRQWIQEKLEQRTQKTPPPQVQKNILKQLIEAESFEHFFQKKYPGARRFSLEGGETLLVALEAILENATQKGVKDVVLGMPHRGRLNVMAHTLQRPLPELIAYFEKNPRLFLAESTEAEGPSVGPSGDVKYHLGYATERVLRFTQSGKSSYRTVRLNLLNNPSHLESINPVVLGSVRRKQDTLSEAKKNRVLGILIHGDASFTGQGVVSEILQLAALEGYSTKGTIHLIINNQLGYTASPEELRSSPYCSDTAKSVAMPIFHVNAQDPEAVAWVAETASEFRALFASDVLIDLVGYRRRGHNETEEPSFTHPLLYKKIEALPTVTAFYQEKLLKEERILQEEQQDILLKIEKRFQKALTTFQERLKGADQETLAVPPKALFTPSPFVEATTGIALVKLRQWGTALAVPPSENVRHFQLHPKLERFLEARREAVKTGEKVDWSFAEALAFASILAEGVPIRLSGQDAVRGTFSQRHGIFMDGTRPRSYCPFHYLSTPQDIKKVGSFHGINSPLSEIGVVGFEYGYSLLERLQGDASPSPLPLVLWEAQFGDFANGAQVIIDQYLSSGEAKWNARSGLVMLLPHGFDGLGAEHSSARLERFLQLCAENNMQVVNCTTPANYFHVLRRQHLQNLSGKPKPLIVMTPKALLRHKEVVSSFKDMGAHTTFQPILKMAKEGGAVLPKNIKRVILCSGQIYYDLLEAVRTFSLGGKVELIRLEQLYPFPRLPLAQTLEPLRQAEMIWCQEEPLHMGPWPFLERLLRELMDAIGSRHVLPVGRAMTAAVATGYLDQHQQERQNLIREALYPWLEPQPTDPKITAETKEIYGIQ